MDPTLPLSAITDALDTLIDATGHTRGDVREIAVRTTPDGHLVLSVVAVRRDTEGTPLIGRFGGRELTTTHYTIEENA